MINNKFNNILIEELNINNIKNIKNKNNILESSYFP
jgi:hypothetical protein